MPYPIPTHTSDGRPLRIFFVCGHMRSGTNWLAAILNLHPDINCTGEGPLGHFRNAVYISSSTDYLYTSREPYRTVVEEAFNELARRLVLSTSLRKPAAQWVGDNTSRQLWPYIPGAHHFHILRDGRDVLTSWTFHQLRIGLETIEPHRTNLAGMLAKFRANPYHFHEHRHELLADEAWIRFCAHMWREYYVTAEFVLREMGAGRMDIRVLPLRYEELMTDFENNRERIYRFLDLNPAAAAAASEETLTSPGFKHDRPDSFYRSGKVGDWKNYATDNFRKWFKEEAGDALVSAGYEASDNW